MSLAVIRQNVRRCLQQWKRLKLWNFNHITVWNLNCLTSLTSFTLSFQWPSKQLISITLYNVLRASPLSLTYWPGSVIFHQSDTFLFILIFIFFGQFICYVGIVIPVIICGSNIYCNVHISLPEMPWQSLWKYHFRHLSLLCCADISNYVQYGDIVLKDDFHKQIPLWKWSTD